VFYSDRDGNREIYVMGANGENPENLTENDEWDYYPSWSSRNVDTFTVKLAGQPSSDVAVTVTSANPDEVTVSQGTLTFTTEDWNVPQIVTVTVSVDADASAEEYKNVSPQDIRVTTTDFD
jgi:Tol biopolymer transport system component